MRSIPHTLFLATLIFAPLAFGSVETWSIGLVEILVFLTAFFLFFQGGENRLPLVEVPGIRPLLLILLLILLQLLPLPPSLVKFIAPGIHQIYAPILAVQESWIPLTVNQKATLLEFLRVSSYVLFYILTVQLLSRQELLTKTVRIIAGLAAAIAFLAILQKLTSSGEIYWFRQTPNGHPMGPWVYKNHYAGFMELVFPMVLALFFFYQPEYSSQQSLRQRIVSLFSSPESSTHLFLGFTVVLIMSSVFLSLSRGGIISITLGLLFFLFLQGFKGGDAKKSLPILLFATVFLAISWFGWDTILVKFIRTSDSTSFLTNDRLRIWRDSVPLIDDFLFTGSGFATFPSIFQRYSSNISNTEFIEHAHNDYIELLADGGLTGFLLGACFVITILRHGFKRLTVRREPYSILLLIGALTALFSILIHSIGDFNMHNGANGLYFFFLCGILVSAGNTRMRHRNDPTLLQAASPQWRTGLLAALPLLALTIIVQGGILRGEKIYDRASQIYLNPKLSEKTLQNQLTSISGAIQADPLEGLYSYHEGHLFYYRHEKQASLDSYLQAARKDPMNSAYLQRVALSLIPADSGEASLLMAESYARSKTKRRMVFNLAEWHLRHERRQEALTVLQQGVNDFPDLGKMLPAFVLDNRLDRKEIRSILPQRVKIWIELGILAEKRKMMEDAEFYFGHALDFLDREKDVHPHYFTLIHAFYQRQKQGDEAVAVLRKGMEWLPDYASFHISLGDYYRRQNIPRLAREEYERALILEPKNEKTKKKLESLQ